MGLGKEAADLGKIPNWPSTSMGGEMAHVVDVCGSPMNMGMSPKPQMF